MLDTFQRLRYRLPLKPRQVQIEITNRCNMDCPMCPREDLNIELAEGVLTIEHQGPKAELLNDSNEVVYQGIAQRAFKQQFTLAENVEVHGADLVNGMLTLALEKIIPDAQKPRSIDIKTPKVLGSK